MTIRRDVERHVEQIDFWGRVLVFGPLELLRKGWVKVTNCSCGHRKHRGKCVSGGLYLADPICGCVK